jgi:hypothetical protein
MVMVEKVVVCCGCGAGCSGCELRVASVESRNGGSEPAAVFFHCKKGRVVHVACMFKVFPQRVSSMKHSCQ